ncbi:hypothetical protein RV134_260049 [Roseovarius sp. EC-HK134]|nr:hypothetical protein RV134_260049 [Roseovarius sp. EC-HK134]VVT08756.1 hypothetical protein RV420_290265 [Roseovarius sp. EC-SD190]
MNLLISIGVGSNPNLVFLHQFPLIDSEMHCNITITRTIPFLVVILERHPYNNPVQSLLAKFRLRQIVLRHAVSNASSSFSSHLHITENSHCIHKVMIS